MNVFFPGAQVPPQPHGSMPSSLCPCSGDDSSGPNTSAACSSHAAGHTMCMAPFWGRRRWPLCRPVTSSLPPHSMASARQIPAHGGDGCRPWSAAAEHLPCKRSFPSIPCSTATFTCWDGYPASQGVLCPGFALLLFTSGSRWSQYKCPFTFTPALFHSCYQAHIHGAAEILRTAWTARLGHCHGSSNASETISLPCTFAICFLCQERNIQPIAPGLPPGLPTAIQHWGCSQTDHSWTDRREQLCSWERRRPGHEPVGTARRCCLRTACTQQGPAGGPGTAWLHWASSSLKRTLQIYKRQHSC